MPEQFQSNPNQRHLTVFKTVSDQNNIYAKINVNAMYIAMKSLSSSAFKFWVYLDKNQDNYSFWLSKVDYLDWANVSASTYSNNFKELVNKKYLIPRDIEKSEPSIFDFYELPQLDYIDENINITINKK